MDLGIKNKTAIITGVNNPWGIGAVTALAFANEGVKLVLVYKKLSHSFDESKTDADGVDRYYKALSGDTSIVEERLRSIGAEFIVIEGDISNEKCVAEIYDKAIETFGKVNILQLVKKVFLTSVDGGESPPPLPPLHSFH